MSVELQYPFTSYNINRVWWLPRDVFRWFWFRASILRQHDRVSRRILSNHNSMPILRRFYWIDGQPLGAESSIQMDDRFLVEDLRDEILAKNGDLHLRSVASNELSLRKLNLPIETVWLQVLSSKCDWGTAPLRVSIALSSLFPGGAPPDQCDHIHIFVKICRLTPIYLRLPPRSDLVTSKMARR